MIKSLVERGRSALIRTVLTAIKADYWTLSSARLLGGASLGFVGPNNDLTLTKYGAALAYCLIEPVYRSVDLRSDAVGHMPWQIVHAETGDVIDKSTDPQPHHPLARAIRDVRRRQRDSLFKLWEIGLCLYGEHFLEPVANPYGYTTGLRWLNPLGVQVIDIGGVIQAFQYVGEGGSVRYEPDELVYDRDFSAHDDVRGWSPTYTAINKANIELNTDRTWNAYYRNFARPDTLISPKEGSWEEEELDIIKTTWKNIFKGSDNRWSAGALPFPIDVTTNDPPDFDKQVALSEHMTVALYRIYGVPLPLAGDVTASPYQSNTDEVHQNFFVDTVKPECLDIAESVNVDLMPWYEFDEPCRFEFVFDAYEAVGESEKRRAEIVQGKVQAGLMSLDKAQEALGEDPDERLRDLYMIGDTPVPAEEIRTLWRVMLNLPDSTEVTASEGPGRPPGLPALRDPQSPPPPPALANQIAVNQSPPTATKADAGRPAYIVLDLADDTEVRRIRRSVREALGSVEGIRWEASPTLHVTLTYIQDVDDETIDGIAANLAFEAVRLTGSRLGIFENGEERALHIQLTPTEPLMRLQRNIVATLSAEGLPLSPYSQPDAYTPHITLGYLPPGVDLPELGNFLLETQSSTLKIARDNYEPYAVVQAAVSFKALREAAETFLSDRDDQVRQELAAWQKFTLRGGTKSRSFEPEHTRGDLADAVHEQLAEADGEEAIKAVFDEAFEQVAVKAITSNRVEFERRFDDLLQQARAGQLNRREWSAQVRQLFVLAGANAYADGLSDGGVIEAPTEEEQQEIERLAAEQSPYVTQFGTRLFSEDGISGAEAERKATQWANKSLMQFYYAGVESAARNRMMEFGGQDGHESCVTCQKLKGQRHRMKDWARKQLVPQQHTDHFECGGWECLHVLYPVDGRARGNWLRDRPGRWAL